MTNPIYFGIADYPEIVAIGIWVCADTRPGKFIRSAMCAKVIVGDFVGIINLPPEDPNVMNHHAVIQKAKRCVDYQRAKQNEHREVK